MFKYKKMFLFILTFLFIVFSFIEFIKYFKVSNTVFGMIYLLNNLFIMFLLVPCAYNYKRKFNVARISKLILIILFGVFNSFILQIIVMNSIDYVDDSLKYIENIHIYKNVFKLIIYIGLTFITIFEFNIRKIIKKSVSKKVD